MDKPKFKIPKEVLCDRVNFLKVDDNMLIEISRVDDIDKDTLMVRKKILLSKVKKE